MPRLQRNEQYLMQRVRAGVDGNTTSVQFDVDAYKESIFLHLQRMFNVRQGSCLTDPEYGLPDFNDLDMKHGFSIAIKEIIKAIKLNISKHESGLGRVSVGFLRDEASPLDLRFEIRGTITVGKDSQNIRFQTRKSTAGFIEVK